MYKVETQPYEIMRWLSVQDAKEYAKSVETMPLKYFCPNGAQEDVIVQLVKANQITKVPKVLVTYPNGIGKTLLAAHIAANFIYGPQNGWFDYPIFRNFPYPKRIWYCSTPDAIKDKFTPEFEKLLNPFAIKSKDIEDHPYEGKKEHKPYVSKYTFHNSDWELSCKSYEQAATQFESADLGFCINDEPAPDIIRKAQKSRRRMGCIILEIMTPLYCQPDTFDDIQKADERVKSGKKRTMWHLETDIYSACKKRGVRGHLGADIIDDMIDDMDEEEKEARAYGKAMYFSGQIYRKLDKLKHFVDSEEFPITGPGQIYMVCDPHESRDSAVIWAFKTPPIGKENPKSRLIIFNEYPEWKGTFFWLLKTQKTARMEVSAWKQYEQIVLKLERSTDVRRILDRHFGWQTRGEKNMAMLFAKAGNEVGWPMTFLPSYTSKGEENEITYGHKLVREQLEDLEDGKPGLVIWNHCQHTWNGLSKYIRKHETTKGAEDKAAGEGKIVDKFRDLPDTVRYLICDTRIVKVDRGKPTEWERQEQIVRGKIPPKKRRPGDMDIGGKYYAKKGL